MPFLRLSPTKLIKYTDTEPHEFLGYKLPSSISKKTKCKALSWFSRSSPVKPKAVGNAPKTLVFINGLGATENYFYGIIPYLSKHRCITIDTHGNGLSKYTPPRSGTTYHISEYAQEESPEDDFNTILQLERLERKPVPTPPVIKVEEKISMDSLVQDVTAVLVHLELTENIVLISHGMGATIAACLALRFPNQVSCLIPISPIFPTPGKLSKLRPQIQRLTNDGSFEPMCEGRCLPSLGHKHTPLHYAFVRELMLSRDLKGYIAGLEAFLDADMPELKYIRVPVMFIRGNDDHDTPDQLRLLNILKDIRTELEEGGEMKKKVEMLEGVGHWPMVEAAEETARLVGEFVDRWG